MSISVAHIILFIIVPVLFIALILYVFLNKNDSAKQDKKYQVRFKLNWGTFKIENIIKILNLPKLPIHYLRTKN